jgi:CRISPR/Cas system-associated exonuclease Cas4 (RecB family)
MADLKPSALKRLKDTYKGDSVLLPAIQRHVMKTPQRHVRPVDHSLGYMHPSDMSHKNWCGRHDYYRIVGMPEERQRGANPSFVMENMLAEGHTIHEKYQRWLQEMGVLWGEWACFECGHIWMALSPTECQNCRSLRVRYLEVPLYRQGALIEGHADGIIHMPDWRGLLEVKSIGVGTLRFEAPRLYNRYQDGEPFETIWWKINRPFTTHLKQGMIYLWLAWPRYEQIAFIYESKMHQQVREFVVDYNPALIAGILSTARAVTSAAQSGQPPDRPEWAETADGTICHSCVYRNTCWSLESDTTAPPNDPKATTVRIRRAAPTQRRRRLQQPA